MLGIRSSDLAELSGVQDLSSLGAWYVNLFVIDRRKCVIFMNEKTLLSFIIFGVTKANLTREQFPEMCLQGIVQLLTLESFPPQVIARVVEESLGYCYAKTDSRRTLGNMNDLMSMYEHMVWHSGGLASCDLNDIILRMNRTPQRNLEWQYSIDAARKALGEHAP